jgi:hypothetical protein
MTNIASVEDVIDALNGNVAVAEITSASLTAVYNWRAAGKFPADTYLLIQDELRARGRVAPDHLWPMRQPARIMRAKKKKPTPQPQRTA